MDMPDGILSQRIDPRTGCPARPGQLGTMFEFFRIGHVPQCERTEEVPDPFNDAGGIDPDPESEEEEESLF